MTDPFDLVTAGRGWGPRPEELATDLRPALLRVSLVAVDFDGVMTDNRVHVDETGRESVSCSRFDSLGLARLRELGIFACIVSTEVNPVVARRAAKLKLEVEHGLEDKVGAVRRFAARRNIGLERCAFIGNDVNDLPALRAVGMPVAVVDAHPAILTAVRHRTERPGGHGAVREFCDLLADLHVLDRARGATRPSDRRPALAVGDAQ